MRSLIQIVEVLPERNRLPVSAAETHGRQP